MLHLTTNTRLDRRTCGFRRQDVGDHDTYLVSCEQVAAFEDLCAVARVPYNEAGDPAAYLYWHAFQGWIADPDNASVELRGVGRVSAAPLGSDRFVAVAGNIWESRVQLWVVDEPSGPYGEPMTLFDAVPPDAAWFIGGGLEHSALRGADRRTLAVSYWTDGAAGPPGLHLVSVRLDEEVGR